MNKWGPNPIPTPSIWVASQKVGARAYRLCTYYLNPNLKIAEY